MSQAAPAPETGHSAPGHTDLQPSSPPGPRRPFLPTFLRRLSQNPVILKELRGRMRGGRAFILLTIYLFVLTGMVSLIYFGYAASENAPGAISTDARQGLGKMVFGIVVGLELMMVSFIAPAMTASAISGEREMQTYDLLRTTLLPARDLVTGKLFSALSFILLLLFVAFPLQSLAYLFGGVSIAEVLIASLMLLVTALAFSAMGLFFSSFIRRTLVSSVLAYASAIMVVFGLPMMILIGLIMLESLLYGWSSSLISVFETGLVLVGWLVVSINPLATAIAAELILVENHSLLYISFPLPSGGSIYLLSPWISYTLIYLLVSLVLIVFSIIFVRRVEK